MSISHKEWMDLLNTAIEHLIRKWWEQYKSLREAMSNGT